MRRINTALIVGLALGCTVTLSARTFYTNYQEFSLLKTVKDHIKYNYVEKDIDEAELEHGAIKGLLAELNDPYTRFVAPKSFSEMKVRMSGEFYGIGIHIGMRDHWLTVISPISGTPADKAGLKTMDRIVSIDGDSTEGLSLEEAVSKIRGERGTPVILGILSEGAEKPRDVSIVRDKIELKAVDKKEVFDSHIGYLRLNTFESKKASEEFSDTLFEFKKKKVDSVIVDLRFNGGGLLRNAVEISSMLLPHNTPVVHTVNRDGYKKTEYTQGNPIYTGPLVILVNEGSASASEILAGAVMDNNRGEIVGRHTFGKASVQNILKLSDGSAVLYTIAKYYTPDMRDINKKGIAVDHEYKIPTDNIEAMKDPEFVYSYETDYQLQKALELARGMH